MTVETLLTHTLIQALGWTLAHFLWQGAAVALLLAAVNAALRRSSANVRYFASCAALLLMLALPLITLWTITSSSLDLALHDVDVISTTSQQPLTDTPFDVKSPSTYTPELRTEPATSPTIQIMPHRSWDFLTSESFSKVMPWLTSLWFAGVVLLSLRMMGGWLYTWRLLSRQTKPLGDFWQQMLSRLCRELRISRTVRLAESALVQVPMAMGWLRPMILIPASAIAGLTPRQLEAIIAHELAHIRRYDYLVNLIQSVVEILLFYHPAVWWVSRQARIEREHCCDDVAVQVCGDALTYARALSEIEELRSATPQLMMAANGGVLIGRIQRLLGAAPRSPYEPAPWMGAIIAFALVFMLAAGSRANIFSTIAQPVDLLKERITSAISNKLAASDKNSAANKSPKSEAIEESKEASHKQSAIEIEKESVEEKDSPSTVEEHESIASVETEQPQSGGYIEELNALGYKGLTVDQLIELRNQGITPAYIRELKDAGYDNLKIEELIRLARHAVSAKYLTAMKSAGFEKLTVQEIVRMRSQAVSPEYVKGLREAGFKDITIDQVIKAAAHAVSLEYVKGMHASGYTNASLDDLIRARDHAVGPEFVKAMRDKGFDNLKLDQVIKVRDHGVSPDYVKELQDLGFTGIQLDDIIRAANNGVGLQYIREIRSLGYTNLSLDQFISMRNNGVSPAYIKDLKQYGFDNLTTEQVVRLANNGVSIDYIKSLKQAGYDRLTIDELVKLRNHGVTAVFIKKVKDQGIQNLSIDQLIRLRNAGIIN